MNPAFFVDNAAMLSLLERWSQHGWLRALDAAFASFLVREESDAPPLLILAAALASHQLGRGHACLDLALTLQDPGFALSLPPEGTDSAAEPLPLPAAVLDGVSLADWQRALAHPQLVSGGDGEAPLVFVGNRLYLRRYWQYEQSVRAGIDARLAAPPALPEDALGSVLGVLFPRAAETPASDWQKLACALAARSAFAIVTGGPGTGKTTTVVRLLAVLQALAIASTEARPCASAWRRPPARPPRDSANPSPAPSPT